MRVECAGCGAVHLKFKSQDSRKKLPTPRQEGGTRFALFSLLLTRWRERESLVRGLFVHFIAW